VSEVAKLAHGEGIDAVVAAAKNDPSTGAQNISEALWQQAESLDAIGQHSEAIRKRGLREQVEELVSAANGLKAKGYAPLQRFGQYTLDVTSMEAGELKREFFGMYESKAALYQAERDMRELFPDATITPGTMNDQKYKLFQGMSLDAIALFAEATGASKNAAVPRLLQARVSVALGAQAAHPAEGHPRLHEDLQRVLASFVTSNARLASKNYHFGEMMRAAGKIPNHLGDISKEATKLVEYVQNPVEEASKIRGLLFVNFLGGSIASALTNMTQPVMMTLRSCRNSPTRPWQ
jgi:hypothetical protein